MKDTRFSKQRLSRAFSPALRQRLAIAMFADVMQALCDTPGLSGILVVTEDREAATIAGRCNARVVAEGARDGHTGAVMAGARRLAAERRAGMLALPGDIPLVTPAEIEAVLASRGEAPCCTLVPAHDHRGTNAVLLSPPDAMALQFGGDSFGPHVATANRLGLIVTSLALPGIALDIDDPEDVQRFLDQPAPTRARTLLLSEHAENKHS